MNSLPVVPLKGLNADSLGVYLASLGLFSLVSREWPTVRACWRDASLCLVGGPVALDEIVEFVSEIGERNDWTRYERPWDAHKRRDVEKKTSRLTAVQRALRIEERLLPLFGAQLALDTRVRMNPLLGTGGNAGRREFDRGWREAVACIESPPRGQSRDSLNRDAKAFLDGGSCACLRDFNAGSWFGTANKIYNHGTRSPSRKGEVTPWAMALACEGLPYFSGSVSRQFGSRRQPKGAFPFVTTAMAPRGEGEAGSIEAEVWAPIWDRPMTDSELRWLFLRGRAEIDGRGATSSSSFAVGVASRGVDAGVTEFRRFLLVHTTSAQTFESRLAGVVSVPKAKPDGAITSAIHAVVKFCDELPEDRKVGGRGRFAGLRGPLEQALVEFAAAKVEQLETERAWALVDAMFETLVKIDRNLTLRSRNIRFQLLPSGWAANLFDSERPGREIRLALALCSLGGDAVLPPFLAHRIGVRKKRCGSRWEFPKSPPAHRVWSDEDLAGNLCTIAERRVMDALRNGVSDPPFRAAIRVDIDDVFSWLSGDVDEEQLRLWLDRLCVFDWSGEAGREIARKLQRNFPRCVPPAVDGTIALYGLFRPLASDWLFQQVVHEGGVRIEGRSTLSSLGRVIAMLRHGDVNAATEVASTAYRSAGVALAGFDALPDGCDPDRLLAALMIPVRDEQNLSIFRRWRRPVEPGAQ